MSDADPALWHCTDPDAFQWRADYDAPFHVYHLKQVVGPCPDGTWLRVDDDVDDTRSARLFATETLAPLNQIPMMSEPIN